MKAEDSVTPSKTYLGEIVESSTSQFVAQCPRERLYQPPEFGSFVKILPVGAQESSTELKTDIQEDFDPFAEIATPPLRKLSLSSPDDSLYAVVFFAASGSFDSGRRASAYEMEERELQETQPQIYELLITEFTALPLGISKNGLFRSGLPPCPPRLHARVAECEADEIQTLTDSPELLRTLLRTTAAANSDELIVACLRNGWEIRDRDQRYLVRMGKQLASLLMKEPDRLTGILDRLSD